MTRASPRERSLHAGTDEDAAQTVRRIAHDLNNLLATIIGASAGLLELPGLDALARADLACIQDAARRGAALARFLQTGEEAKPVLLSLNAWLDSMARLVTHALKDSRIRLLLSPGETDGQVWIDPARLERIILNLVTNARHATPAGGRIELATYTRRVGIAEHHVPDTIPPGEYAVLIVSDTGMGIAAERLTRIFESGHTTRAHLGGSGLGLASVHALTRASGGWLSARSIEGEGSSFVLYLPLHGAPFVPDPVVGPVAGEGVVLLVEDDPLVLRITRGFLERDGWIVRTAAMAEEALALLVEHPCDLLLSDVSMPGMDGIALARRAREMRPLLPIILTSGYAGLAVEDLAGDSVVFLTKPYERETLLDALRRVGRIRS